MVRRTLLLAALFASLAGASTISDSPRERAIQDLEADEAAANHVFSKTVPDGLTTNEALLLAQEAANDLELKLSWHRWAAHSGNTVGAMSLAEDYWALSEDAALSDGRRHAYRVLSCEWYRRAAAEDNYARVAARDRGCPWVK